MSDGPKIETPRGQIFINDSGKAELKWNTEFQPKWHERYSLAQKFVDSEVLRLCDPLVPFQTGMLRNSGILGTDLGSGSVYWIAPYAKAQYYRTRKVGTKASDQCGPFWFERMKQVSGQRIIEGAKKIAGSGGGA